MAALSERDWRAGPYAAIRTPGSPASRAAVTAVKLLASLLRVNSCARSRLADALLVLIRLTSPAWALSPTSDSDI